MSRKSKVLIAALFAFLTGLSLGLTAHQEQRIKKLEDTVEGIDSYIINKQLIEADQQRMIDAREEGIRYQEEKESDEVDE